MRLFERKGPVSTKELGDLRDVTPQRRDELIDYVAREIVRRELVTPAIFFLEINRPLSFVGSQFVAAFSPIAGVFMNEHLLIELGALMEDRSNIDRLIDRIEVLNREHVAKLKEERELRRQERERMRQERGRTRRS